MDKLVQLGVFFWVPKDGIQLELDMAMRFHFWLWVTGLDATKISETNGDNKLYSLYIYI